MRAAEERERQEEGENEEGRTAGAGGKERDERSRMKEFLASCQDRRNNLG